MLLEEPNTDPLLLRACFGETNSPLLKQIVAVRSALPAIIPSGQRSADTGRRPFYGQAIASLPSLACGLCGAKRHRKVKGPGLCRGCYDKARMTMVTIRCPCGVVFERKRYEVEKALGRNAKVMACSNACPVAARLVQTTAPKHCRTCGALIAALAREAKKRYCGKECWPQKKPRAKRPPANWRMAECPGCTRPFIRSTRSAVYCCRTCANAAHSERMTGPGNPRFVDGLSYAVWFRSMRPLILFRDNHACRSCGVQESWAKDGRSQLVVHHINEVTSNNEPENLITLCVPCHMRHHKSTLTASAQFASMAAQASASMTSKWTERTIFLRTKYSSTIA